MAYNIKKPTSTKTLPPAGTHIARIFSIVHVGTHKKEGKDGKPWEVAMARVSFEMPLETKVFKDGEPAKPIVITKKYTESLGEKANLRKLIEAVIGTSLIDEEAYAFDLHEIIGKPCIITVKHKVNPANKEEYAYIDSVSSLMKGQECPPQVNPTYVFELNPFSEEKFMSLPEFIQKEIIDSPEYKSRLTTDDKEKIASLRKDELDQFNASSASPKTSDGEIDPSEIQF